MHVFIGAEIGLILSFFEKVFTDLHGCSPPPFTYALQFTTAVSIYALDRLEDVRSGDKDATSHPELFQLVSEKEDVIESIANVCTIASVALMAHGGATSALFIPLYLGLTYGYRDIKAAVPILKPLIVAVAFGIISVILPCVIADSNFSIFGDGQALLPVIMHMYSSSNLNDLADADSDKKAGIMTLPVVYGAGVAKTLSGVVAMGALAMH
ncbi:unnamed protein product, partial [Phaeothamnion confervicola]